ncbi:ParA family protein [Butyrivibrio sp. XPD2002]|uniref:ParA family protein n=1 Tax=Butyrivibrio sp. XPD2002 TaxID=1280665 RepID=UPI000416F34E|nr:ParA family protein [Butyrivibrio sp. XPD2002]
MKTIAFCNQKGGVAKTTSTYALASGLAKKKYSVLMIDSDPQENLSQAAGIDLYNIPAATLSDVFKTEKGEPGADINEALIPISDHIDLIIGGIEFTSADLDYSGVTSREFMLKRALKKLKKSYDFCIIDCSPTLALITQNVLAITDKIVVPMTPEAFATNGANMLFSWISVMSERLNNPDLDVAGILVTNCRNTNNANIWLEGIEMLAKEYEIKVYDTKIHQNVAVEESQTLNQSLFDYAPNARATKDYEAFVKEFLKGESK